MACRAGTGCGGCRPTIAELLTERAPGESPGRSLMVLDPSAFALAS